MSKAHRRIVGFPRVVIVGLLGALIGALFAEAFDPFPRHGDWSKHLLPDAYRISKIPGTTALRLAMVHDILHERYLRHGPAWCRKRNENAAKILAAGPTTQPIDEKYFDAMDDTAIGLQQLGDSEAAMALMRKKLAMLPPLPARPASRPDNVNPEADDLQRMLEAKNLSPQQHHQYTACANLGTILLIHCMGKAMAGDAAAKAQMRESLDLIEHALAINPAGHFGRETWQAILIEDLLAAIDHPKILADYDVFGDPLKDIKPIGSTLYVGATIYARHRDAKLDDQYTVDERLQARRPITPVGIDPDWQKIVKSDYNTPMPFDEPTLAIIGMWTMGGGPNPHFALALGRIMEDVGQRTIAWNAYERAVELQDTFWPDPTVRQKMVNFCHDRQDEIAKTESPKAIDTWQTKMRKQHQDELAWGQAYQKAYQDYEAVQVDAGVSIEDPHFYDTFFKARPVIASNPGLSDDLIVSQKDAASLLPCMLLGLGLGMCLALVLPEKHLS